MNELWIRNISHESRCVKSIGGEDICICNPKIRIQLLQHILAGCILDTKVRDAILHELYEIVKCNSK
jgi:hypothetical protein